MTISFEDARQMVKTFRYRGQAITLRPEQLEGLVFGQQHILTQSFFSQRADNYHTVPLERFPHFEFLREHLHDQFSHHPYSRYLDCSWDYYYGPGANTRDAQKRKIRRFVDLYEKVAQRRSLGEQAMKPIVVCRRPDEKLLVVDGNHRASIALCLKQDLRAIVIEPSRYLKEVAKVRKEFYGTKRNGRPYQSIFYRGEELVPGRRRDVDTRIQQVAADDIKDKRVLDLGSNIGMNCYLAAENGAAFGMGLEGSPKIASAAVRLNSYFAAPVEFVQHDLNEPADVGNFDTVFCFSLVAHLRTRRGVIETFENSGAKVLYFEGHARTQLNDYQDILNHGRFSRIDFIGYMSDGWHTSACTRPLYRCEV